MCGTGGVGCAFFPMKIIVADKISESGVSYLREQEGFTVVEAYGSTPEQLNELAVDADAIIVRSASSVTAATIAKASCLKAVGRAGVGVDNIDVSAATDRGVIVMNTPGGNTIATAELAFTHLLCSARPIPQAHASMCGGKWDKKSFQGAELFKKVIGILGLGRIGTEVAKRAKAFEMTVLAYDPYLTGERARELGVRKVELDELYAEADFISVHMPKTEATKNLLNADAFAKMKRGVRIINCARGGLLDETALASAVESGRVAAVGLDVFEREPLPADSPLRALDRVVMTPHLGASTLEAQENVGLEVAECVTEALRGGWVRNAVNAPSVDPDTLKVLRPYLALAYKMGTFMQQITPDQIGKLRITYSGRLLDVETGPINRALQRGYLRLITDDVNDVNAPRVMKRLGIEGEIVKSSLERDYAELIRLEAFDTEGGESAIEGTILGKSLRPRLTFINGRAVEVSLDDRYFLVVENEDVPGIVGMLGTVLAKHSLNISNMSLSRNSVGGVAVNLCGLDSCPPAAALEEIGAHAAIRRLSLVNMNGE